MVHDKGGFTLILKPHETGIKGMNVMGPNPKILSRLSNSSLLDKTKTHS
jgi:hypothetical protein